MKEKVPEKITTLRQQSPEEVAHIREQRIESVITLVMKEMALRPALSKRVGALKMGYDLAYSPEQVGEMEEELLRMPPRWKNENAEAWFALAASLREKREAEGAKKIATEALEYLEEGLRTGKWFKNTEAMTDQEYKLQRFNSLPKLASVFKGTTEDDWKQDPIFYYLAAQKIRREYA